MKSLIAALLLALVASPVMAGDAADITLVKTQGPHQFIVRDLVMMQRVSDPQLSPVCAARTGRHAIYVLDLTRAGRSMSHMWANCSKC